MNTATLDEEFLGNHVRKSLEEDLGEKDITTELIPNPDHTVQADLIPKEEGVLSGRKLVESTFEILTDLTSYSDELLSFHWHCADGDQMIPGTTFGSIQGPSGLLLTGERVALNYLQTMSGVATRTKSMVKIAQSYGVQVFDTRKTIPHHRSIQKYAVRCGGGNNHRSTLSDSIIIKDNHKLLSDGISNLLRKAKDLNQDIIVEIHKSSELEDELHGFLKRGDFDIDVVMLDNIIPPNINKFTKFIPDSIQVEASGGITHSNLEEYCQTNIDRVSVGALTHSLTGIDISLDMQLT